MNHDTTGGPSVEELAENKRVGFKFVNEEDGKPLEKVDVRVIFSKGNPVNEYTLANGEVWFNNAPPGNCDLEECNKDHILLEKKGEYTLQKDDTLNAIADKETQNGNPVTWQEIAAFNWGEATRDKKTCNEFMRDELKCFTYASSLGVMAYDGANGPHSIEIPRKMVRKGLALDTCHEIKVRIRQTPPHFIDCCAIPNITFDCKTSFIRPNVEKYLTKLKEQVKKHPDAKLMIFGHTDKMNDETLSKQLSERRARSAYALLTKNPGYWMALYIYQSEQSYA